MSRFKFSYILFVFLAFSLVQVEPAFSNSPKKNKSRRELRRAKEERREQKNKQRHLRFFKKRFLRLQQSLSEINWSELLNQHERGLLIRYEAFDGLRHQWFSKFFSQLPLGPYLIDLDSKAEQHFIDMFSSEEAGSAAAEETEEGFRTRIEKEAWQKLVDLIKEQVLQIDQLPYAREHSKTTFRSQSPTSIAIATEDLGGQVDKPSYEEDKKVLKICLLSIATSHMLRFNYSEFSRIPALFWSNPDSVYTKEQAICSKFGLCIDFVTVFLALAEELNLPEVSFERKAAFIGVARNSPERCGQPQSSMLCHNWVRVWIAGESFDLEPMHKPRSIAEQFHYGEGQEGPLLRFMQARRN